MADPRGLDYWRRGEALPWVGGKATGGLDYWRRGEVYRGIATVASGSPQTIAAAGLPSAERGGAASVGASSTQTVTVAGLRSAETWGAASVGGTYTETADATWPQDAHDARRSGSTTLTPSTPWSLAWAWNGPDSAGGAGGATRLAPPEARPVASATQVFAPVGDEGVVCLDLATGAESWVYNAEPVDCAPAYHAATDRLLVCTRKGNVVKLNAATGAVVDRFYAGGGRPLRKAPLLVGTDLYVVNDLGALYKLALGAAGAALSQTWLYAGGASAGQPADTPPAYAPGAGKIIYCTRDLYVHAVGASSGTASWRVKPTTNSAVDPYTFDGGWPVVADGHNVVLVRLTLAQADLGIYPSGAGNIYPSGDAAGAGATIRAWLVANPDRQHLYALSLLDGGVAFVPPVGYGSVEGLRGGTAQGVVQQMPVVAVQGADEVAYVAFRNGAAGPPDYRWDGHLGEMVLDTAAVPGLAVGDLRFVRASNVGRTQLKIIDEQCPLVRAGDMILHAHWGASEGVLITDRADARGLTYADPVVTTDLPPVLRQITGAGGTDADNHHSASGTPTMYDDGRAWGSGEYFWAIQGATEPPGKVATSAYSAGATARCVLVAGAYILVVGNGGSILALRHSGSGYARSAASALTLTGPTSGRASVASSAFTVALSPAGASHAGVTVTLADGGAGGTFSANGFVLSTSKPRKALTYTPASGAAGTTVTITTTNDGGLTNP